MSESNACLGTMNALHVQQDMSESSACLGSMNALHVQQDMCESNACLGSMNALHVQHDMSESNACLGSMNALHVQQDMSESNACLGSMNALHVQQDMCESNDLSTFSNHAPIVFSFSIGTYIIPQTSYTGNSYKWNPLYREQWLHDISRAVGNLEQHLTDGISVGLNTDILVEQFTTFLVSTGNQYFQHTNNATKHTRFYNADRNKQKWYKSECKRRHDEYKLAVNTTIIEMM